MRRNRARRDCTSARLLCLEAGRTMEVIVQGIQRRGLQLPKYASQALLDPVYRVIKVPPVDAQLPRAELPIRAEDEVVPEQLVLELRQSPFRNQREVRDILLVLAPPTPRAS